MFSTFFIGGEDNDSGVSVLCHILRASNQLKILHLSGNPISDEGAHKVATLMSSHSTPAMRRGQIVEMDLSSAWITSTGAVDVAQALSLSEKMRTDN